MKDYFDALEQADIFALCKEAAERSDNQQLKDLFKSDLTTEDWEKAVSEGEFILFK